MTDTELCGPPRSVSFEQSSRINDADRARNYSTSRSRGVSAAVVERDYILAHIVAQLHLVVLEDEGRLVFKGGTALRLVHIGDYRYSADLDFTLINGASTIAMQP
jgi:predicted nucleotidyltransferase component of viral defense system